MSDRYRLVQWNRHKVLYDLCVAGAIAAFLAVFLSVGIMAFPAPGEISPPILLMRGLGLCGVFLLHVILSIGPLARFDNRCAVLLYNRRHLGVAFFVVVLLHALVAVGFYGGFGRGVWLLNVTSGAYRPGAGVPFEVLGFLASVLFFAMAATSHDAWLRLIGPMGWKRLHMFVYAAYGLVVGHVALGAMQDRVEPAVAIATGLGVVWLVAIHLAAGLAQLRRDRATDAEAVIESDGSWVDAGPVDSIEMNRAVAVTLPDGSPVAVFRHGDTFSAVSGVCAHQGGPLAEGEIVDGCITCPWHGYQYRPEDGCSPPPYTERLKTYELRVRNERIEIRAETGDETSTEGIREGTRA